MSEAGSRFDDSLADKTKLKTKRKLIFSHQLLNHFQFIVLLCCYQKSSIK